MLHASYFMLQDIHLDATNQILGRLASKIASLLRGKDLATFAPNRVPDRKIIVSNVEKITVTGQKMNQKMYWRHSGYPGNIKGITLQQLFSKNPKRPMEWAVYGMLPKNKLRAKMMKNLVIQ